MPSKIRIHSVYLHQIYISHDLCARLLKDTAVALLLGATFGMKSEILTARLAYVVFDGTKAIDEMHQGVDILTSSVQKVTIGIKQMTN